MKYRRILAMMLATLMTVTAVPVDSLAAEINEVIEVQVEQEESIEFLSTAEGEWYTVEGIVGGRIKFDASKGIIIDCEETVTEAVIPERIDGVSVTSIGQDEGYGYGVFNGCNDLEKLVLPASIITISSNAFDGCSNLKSAGPIGSGADYEYGWTESIPDNAFSRCSGLETVQLIFGITHIGDAAFAECGGLKSIELPSSLKSIGFDTFEECTGLESIEIPSGVTSIGGYAFNGCSGLTNIKIPSSVTSINYGAFVGCSSLKSAGPIGSGCDYEYGWTENIPGGAFEECSGLESIEIPSSVTNIGRDAFSGCSSLTSIEIPSSVISIGNNAFSECSSLKNAGPIGSGADYEYGWIESIPDNAFSGCNGLSSIEILSSITSIGNSAFSGCSSLTEIKLSSNITNIGYNVFYGCSSLKSAGPIGSGSDYEYGWIESIPENAFAGCSGLIGIELLPSITSIGNDAFLGCSGLKSAGPTGSGCDYEYGWTESIPHNAFSGCDGLTSIEIPSSITSIGDDAFSGCSGLTSIELPTSLTSIGNAAFSGCSSLISIKLPEGITNIGTQAFRRCSSLTSIEIPSSITSIGNAAFEKCSGLRSAGPMGSGCNIEYGWTESIPNRAFSFCSSLISIEIPSSITSIGDDAFSGCSELNDAGPIGSGCDYEYGWTESIPDNAFSGCDGLINIELPSSITSIGDRAFSRCSSLENIELPPGLTVVSQTAFWRCSSLTSIILPENLETIEWYAFGECSNLQYIVFKGNVPMMTPDVFKGTTTVAYYPADNNTWTADKLQNYGGTITWVPYTGEFFGGGISYDETTKCLTITGTDPIPDYEDRSETPWYAYREEIESIIIGDEVPEIGKKAFSGCRNVKEVTIGKSVTRIGEQAFANCMDLKELVIPASVKTIGERAFWNCCDMDNIYFEGSAPMFGKNVFEMVRANAYYLENDQTWKASVRQDYGGWMTWLTWHGMREEGYLYIDRMELGDIVVNGSGYGYAYFKLTDIMGNPVKNKEISYTFSGTTVSGSTVTDDAGMFYIRTMHLTGTTEVEAVITVDSELPVQNVTQTILVTVTKPSFEQSFSHDGFVSGGADLEVVDGSASVGDETKVEYSVKDNKKELTISETFESGWSLNAFKLDLEAEKALGKNCIPKLEAKSSAEWDYGVSIGLHINEYDVNNQVQAMRITMLLLSRHVGSLLIAQIAESIGVKAGVKEGYDFYINQIGVENATSLGANGTVSLTNGNQKTKLFSAGKDTEYSSEMSLDETDVILTKSMAAKTTGDFKLIEFDKVKTSLFESKNTNAVNIEVKTDKDGKDTISSTMTDGLDRNVLLLETVQSKTRTMTLDDDSIEVLKNSQADIKNLVSSDISVIGTTAFSNAVDKIWSASVDGTITDSQKTKVGINVEVETGYPKKEPVLTIGVGTSLAHELSYPYDSYAWVDGKQYKTAESTLTNADIQTEVITLPDVYKNAFEGCYDLIVDSISSIKGQLSENGVTYGGAKVAGESVNFFAGISTVRDASAVQAAFYTLDEEEVMTLEAGEDVLITPVFTVGNPYYVEMSKEDGSLVTNDELKEETIYITLTYDDAMLAEAGITDENAIALYWYDMENGVHVYQEEAVIDKDANTATVLLKANGEYVLGADGSAPTISEMCVTNHTSESEFKAIIADDSNIKSIEMSLDGNQLVNEGNFSEYYDQKTKEFKVPLSNLAEGEHTITINACDMLGNTELESYMFRFNVDTEKPVISNVVVSEQKILTNEALKIQATVSDDQAMGDVVCELVNSEGCIKYVDLEVDEDGFWKGELLGDLGSGEYSLDIRAVDEAGNQSVHSYAEKIHIISKEDFVISSVTESQGTENAIVTIDNQTSKDTDALLVCLGYAENGTMLYRNTVQTELLQNSSTDVLVKDADEKAAWETYFLLKDNYVISDVFVNEITTEPMIEVPLAEETIQISKVGGYLINLINNENVKLRNDHNYMLMGVSNSYTGAIDVEKILSDKACIYIGSALAFEVDDTIAVNFGTIDAENATIYIVGAGKLQKVCDLSKYTEDEGKDEKPTDSTNIGFGKQAVYRIAGATRYETSLKTADAYKAQLGVDKFSTVILADGRNFPDALAGSYLAGKLNAPILMANQKTQYVEPLRNYIKSNLKSGGTIYVLGGTSAVPDSVLQGLEGFNVKRLAGANRYETNLMILNEAGVSKEDILVCTGRGFADSLSASATGKPILLIGKNVTAEQEAFMNAHRGNKYYIIGGDNAVNKAVESVVRSFGTTERLAGASRYETSILVAEKFFKNPDVAVLAFAKNFPDGLCGGPLAMSKNAPLILTATGKEANAVTYANTNGIKYGAVLGGDGLIDDAATMSIFGASSITVW